MGVVISPHVLLTGPGILAQADLGLVTGAHVEYLYQRGELAAANVEEIEKHRQVVICYRRV